MHSLQLRLHRLWVQKDDHLNSVGSGLSSGLGMVACSRSSTGRRLSGPSQPSPRLLVRRLGRGVGCSPPGRNCFRPLVSGGSSVVQRKGASCSGVRSTALPSFGSQLHSSGLFGQLYSLGLPSQTGGHSISGPQFLCAEDPPRPSRHIPPGPCPSGLAEVSPVLYWPSHLPVSGSLLWSVFCSAGIYSCHGPDLLNYASPRFQDSPPSRRLARPWILPRGNCADNGLFIITL